MYKLLTGIPGVTLPEPQGAFYCFPNLGGLLGRRHGGPTRPTPQVGADPVETGAMVAYAEQTGCRVGTVLRYFGEEPAERCGRCDNCGGIGVGASSAY